MASRIEPFSVTVPAGTSSATPLDFPTTFNEGIVEKLEIIIPPGFSGLVGFKLVHSGTVVIPYQYDEWIISDSEKIEWTLQGYPTGSAWAVRAYNEDVYDHTMYLRYLVTENERYTYVSATPLDIIQTAPSAVE